MESNKTEETKPEFTAENPDPNSNHDWYAQFDPTSKEYHNSLDKRVVPFGPVVNLPETMPSEYKPGMTESDALAVEDPTKDDAVCIEIQAGYKYCGDLKKKLTEFSKAIQTRGELVTKKRADAKEGDEEKVKEYNVLGPKNKTQYEELKAWIAENSKNPHVDDMSDVFNEFWKIVDGLGKDIESIKTTFNVEFTKVTRALFKVQQSVMAKLKDRKKELTTKN